MKKRTTFKDLIRYVTDCQIYLQAELYHQCKNQDIELYLEQSLSAGGRPDAIIVFNENPIIVEFKIGDIYKNFNPYDHQIFRYLKSKTPLFLLGEEHEIAIMLDFIKEKDLKKGLYIFESKKKTFKKIKLKEFTEENFINYRNKLDIKRTMEIKNGR